jgi:hypothetical protein
MIASSLTLTARRYFENALCCFKYGLSLRKDTYRAHQGMVCFYLTVSDYDNAAKSAKLQAESAESDAEAAEVLRWFGQERERLAKEFYDRGVEQHKKALAAQADFKKKNDERLAMKQKEREKEDEKAKKKEAVAAKDETEIERGFRTSKDAKRALIRQRLDESEELDRKKKELGVRKEHDKQFMSAGKLYARALKANPDKEDTALALRHFAAASAFAGIS